MMKEECSTPSKEELTNTDIGCDIEWDPVATFLMSL